jgi:hypothetical protein
MKTKKNLLLRLDPGLFKILQKWSDDELRSINAQIEYILREAARKAGRLKQKNPDDGCSDR